VSGRGTSPVECPARRHRHERADSGPDHHGRGCRKPRVVQAAGTGAIRLALSDELLKEAVEVVRRKDRQGQIVSASLAFEAAMDLWSHGFMYHPFRLDWPRISDREDYWVLDLAWEAKVDYIISVDPHLTKAKLSMPIEVLEPSQLIRRLDL
jgi:predicted nucleic acid-binding protein